MAKDTAEHPYISNYPPLKEWLAQHDAHCMWQIPSSPDWREHYAYPQFYIECWSFPATRRLAIIVVHSRKMGWFVYTDGDSNEIAATLNDAEKRLGLIK